ncbi:MucR family transcriptional regulator [Rhizobium sp. VS19-DR104.2]|uniref:MucR family transcriptional regulator n=1 Tax=unclassified Rhizobium TaxID=2613769 RepID=UPI001ADC2F88|nr:MULTISPECIES: MucR family transcriptional regulator [unclassified Rhizobium]MBO9101067.1 MucR family transcriptional regulator [Rhizobium sp. L58/93]MBO9135374.1 MucR family transcriptional regulator [Rhizobium sp. B209b/85]MBO9186655.1 MucR family transcriptional regulator [Rhizobium sp. E27B/91]MBZ5762435.1 MucR family transcriptional regulator [Rhizobium sp. VS19-DR96]MBZ5768414.1 MucR family transcriptional regulator [Rhizobium sp. VS19-DR129.2]
MSNENRIEDADKLVQLAAAITAAYLSNHVVPVNDIANLIISIKSALKTKSGSAVLPVAEKRKPAISVRKSLQDDRITCLECGEAFKSLKRHIITNHALSPEAYRVKWALPADYPMVAPAYSRARSQLATEMGLGQRRKKRLV